MSNNDWMDKHALGELASTTGDYPKDRIRFSPPTGLSVDKRRLLEDYLDGIITTEEFQIELSVLNSTDK